MAKIKCPVCKDLPKNPAKSFSFPCPMWAHLVENHKMRPKQAYEVVYMIFGYN